MNAYLFPDNTVLCNFASVDRLDLLKAVLNGRGRWTEAVAYEAARSSQVLPALTSLADGGWLGEPIEVSSDSDVQRVQRIRRTVFGGTDDQPLKHLGEAETCFVIKEWSRFNGSWWISDDQEAVRYARFQGIPTRETVDLMSVAAVDGEITAQEGFDLMLKMIDQGRHLRLPASAADLLR